MSLSTTRCKIPLTLWVAPSDFGYNIPAATYLLQPVKPNPKPSSQFPRFHWQDVLLHLMDRYSSLDSEGSLHLFPVSF